MSHFVKMRATTSGADLLSKAHEGVPLKLLGIQVGTGMWSEEERMGTPPAALKNMQRSVAITKFDQHEGAVVLHALLTNTGLETGFMMTELGVTAQHPDNGEILYMADFVPPEMASFLPPDSTAPVEVPIKIEVATGTGTQVVIKINDRFVSASKEELEEAVREHSDAADPHPNMRVAAPHLAIPNGMVNKVHEGEKLGMTVSGVPENPMWETEVKFQIIDSEGNDVTEQFSPEIADKSVTITAAQVTGDTDFKARFQTWQHGGLKSLWSNEFPFTVIDVPVDSPAFTSPANHATGLGETPTFAITPGSSDDDTKQHVHTQFMITRDLLRHVVVTSSGTLGAITAWAVPAGYLQTNQHLYAHARTQWGDTWSGWTTIDVFTTDQFQFIEPPTILAPQQGAEVMWNGLICALSTPVVEDGGVLQHSKSEVEISKDGVVIDTVTVTTNLLAVPLPDLGRGSDFTIRARAFDDLRGWSEWSAVRAFRTKNVAHGVRVDGGIAVGPHTFADGKKGFLVVAPGDQRQRLSWGLVYKDTSLANIASNFEKDTKTGAQNTTVLCSSLYRSYTDTYNNVGSPAANHCHNKQFEGHNDFVLPSKDEADLMYKYRNVIDAADESINNKFFQIATGDASYAYIWSSSENSSSKAWRQHLTNGDFGLSVKGNSSWCVPCRRIITG